MSRVPGGVGPQKKFGEYLAYGTTDKPSFGNYRDIFENMNHPSADCQVVQTAKYNIMPDILITFLLLHERSCRLPGSADCQVV